MSANDTAITVRGIGKRYRLGATHGRLPYRTLRDRMADALRAPLRRLTSGAGPTRGCDDRNLFWALKEISFDVPQGQVLGVIGRNGAGKSTLLKILSQITEPTEGEAWIGGRVGSLLEVGTGFHPELTGRENIFLNGAILGMKRAEIRRSFDEIVAFAEIERFLDTPVKRYSSGMYVRLAFAVAAHLTPEILLVDEVLAVGDQSFQEKCLGKMRDVSRSGRTVLFVSHQMAAIRKFCSRCLLLDGGRLALDDDADTVVHTYLSSLEEKWKESAREAVYGKVTLADYWVVDARGQRTQTIVFTDPFELHFVLAAPGRSEKADVHVLLTNSAGVRVASIHSLMIGAPLIQYGDRVHVVVDVLDNALMPGKYYAELHTTTPGGAKSDLMTGHLPAFQVVPKMLEHASRVYDPSLFDYGTTYLRSRIRTL